MVAINNYGNRLPGSDEAARNGEFWVGAYSAQVEKYMYIHITVGVMKIGNNVPRVGLEAQNLWHSGPVGYHFTM